jgi:hypothetical protein
MPLIDALTGRRFSTTLLVRQTFLADDLPQRITVLFEMQCGSQHPRNDQYQQNRNQAGCTTMCRHNNAS